MRQMIGPCLESAWWPHESLVACRTAALRKPRCGQDPTSDVYKKALEMTSKAPGLHAELQKQLREAQVCGKCCMFAIVFPALPPVSYRAPTCTATQ